MNKIYQKSFSGGKHAGFTLIELLVVVLIIGILAAVALPQYEKAVKKAVKKARFTQLTTLTAAIYRAQKVYKLANGKYSFDFSVLDVSLPSDMQPMFTTNNGLVFGMKNTQFQCVFSSVSNAAYDEANFVACLTNKEPRLISYITLSTGKHFCGATTGKNEEENWCKYLTKKQSQDGSWGIYSLYLFDNVP